VSEWQPIETAPREMGSPPILVTNSICARNAFGHMSHVWLVMMIHDQPGGGVCAFTEGDQKIHGLTHWAPVPVADEAAAIAKATGNA
jgi:hypothetical protein